MSFKKMKEKIHPKKIALFSVVLVGLYATIEERAVYPEGIMIKDEPYQKNMRDPYELHWNEYTVKTLAEFKMEGKILAKERYRFDTLAKLVPYDFALGWKEMSDEGVIRQLDISQKGRWYTWSMEEPYPISIVKGAHTSANMHMIPTSINMKDKLGKARVGDIIFFEGKLVEISDKKGHKWKSSMTRKDRGGGACEVILLEKFEIREKEGKEASLSFM